MYGSPAGSKHMMTCTDVSMRAKGRAETQRHGSRYKCLREGIVAAVIVIVQEHIDEHPVVNLV